MIQSFLLDSVLFFSRPGISTHVGDPRWSLSHHRGFGFEVPHEVGEVRGAQILDAAWGNSRLIRCPFEHPLKRLQVSFYSDLCGPFFFCGIISRKLTHSFALLGGFWKEVLQSTCCKCCKYGSSVFSSYDFGPFQRK